jgi:hypothetical protein
MAWAVSPRNRGLMPADSIELLLCSILKSRRMRWAGCYTENKRSEHTYSVLVENLEGTENLEFHGNDRRIIFKYILQK